MVKSVGPTIRSEKNRTLIGHLRHCSLEVGNRTFIGLIGHAPGKWLIDGSNGSNDLMTRI
jgi:hypothetical protein